MATKTDFDILIIGGGLAGLTSGLQLSQQGFRVMLIEKYAYPHHKVCGEYVSNEILPYLNSLGVFPHQHGATRINTFEISATTGTKISTKLPLGGFGMSRYALDLLLYNTLVKTANVTIDTLKEVTFLNNQFTAETLNGATFNARFAIGAWGKRSILDKKLNRLFISKPSNWLAVKAHYNYNIPQNIVQLHNFKGGYCGLSKTETNAVNACYLTNYNAFKKIGNVVKFQQTIMSKNPFLKDFFENAKPLFEKPLTISQISFQPKQVVVDHILMVGDTAGLIHPLCGNGMAMAIHSAKLVADVLQEAFKSPEISRAEIEKKYTHIWQQEFSSRLATGRGVQRVLLHKYTAPIGFAIAKKIPSVVTSIIKRTHGKVLV